MSHVRLTHRCRVVATFAALALASCRKHDTPPPQPAYAYPYPYPYPYAYPYAAPQAAPWPPGYYGPSAPYAAPPPPPAFGFSDPFAAARQTCVDRINQYRARVRVAPIARDPSTEACDDDESRLDSSSNRPHGSFGKCGERAQNACPNYPGASVEDVLNKCLQQMFDEGPGGGHFENLTSTKYSRASCGFVAGPGGRIWTVQNFFK